MTILLTNDDGIDSLGLQKLAEIVSQFSKEIYIVAPDSQRSAVSHQITVREELLVRNIAFSIPVRAAYSCSGSPADCVKIAVRELLPVKPDFVISGINYGYNVGYDTIYSGTVAAAMEGMYYGIDSIAVSTDRDRFELVEKYLPQIVKECMQNSVREAAIWNINFPDCSVSECQGISKVVPGIFSQFIDFYEKREVTKDCTAYKISNVKCLYEEEEGTDVHAIKNNYIAVGTLGYDFLKGRRQDAYEVTGVQTGSVL